MKFFIKRSSHTWDPELPPVEGADRITYTNILTGKEKVGWCVHIQTLSDLCDFIEKNGEIIIYKSERSKDINYEIFIYDGYGNH